jgi:hypothetical protein
VGGADARVGERRTRARGERTFTAVESSTIKILHFILFRSRDCAHALAHSSLDRG